MHWLQLWHHLCGRAWWFPTGICPLSRSLRRLAALKGSNNFANYQNKTKQKRVETKNLTCLHDFCKAAVKMRLHSSGLILKSRFVTCNTTGCCLLSLIDGPLPSYWFWCWWPLWLCFGWWCWLLGFCCWCCMAPTVGVCRQFCTTTLCGMCPINGTAAKTGW